MNDISVDIERLVLDGDAVGPNNGQQFARMTEAALQRLFEQSGLPSGMAGGDATQVVAPDVSLHLHMSVEQKGRAVALAIYRALGGSEVKL
ncbi:MAG TPA: hypothetical protein VF538_09945 [Pyrinomonadaceae bacterium]|jgi:hypothetical protein